MVSRINQNFHLDCEKSLHGVINASLHASYVYFTLALHFARHDVALKNLNKFFKERYQEKIEQAEKLFLYLHRRGGHISLYDIKKPEMSEWAGSLDALASSLEVEKFVKQSMLDLHRVARRNSDPNLCNFLWPLIDEEVTIMKCLADHITTLKRLRSPPFKSGEYMFDKHTLGESCKVPH
ncbi:ferritin heavy chain B-like [Monodelphis domestica]|uniref:Ferritin n=1 Tax=Monodelphis domestica TaxID=13616 RepID=A0A5F8GMH6_MONDO|nr:ferritin heavy chain B-like [Monodelphis domestica]